MIAMVDVESLRRWANDPDAADVASRRDIKALRGSDDPEVRRLAILADIIHYPRVRRYDGRDDERAERADGAEYDEPLWDYDHNLEEGWPYPDDE